MGVDCSPVSAGEASGRKKNAQIGDDTRATAHKHNHEKHSGDARRGQKAPFTISRKSNFNMIMIVLVLCGSR